MSWIVARIRFSGVKDGGTPIQPDEAQRFISQVRSDALYGTFADLDEEFWRQRMAWEPNRLSEAEMIGSPVENSGVRYYEFELRLASDLFPPKQGGIQHLFGILAGDLFTFAIPPIEIKSVNVIELRLPDNWRESQFDNFRKGKSNSIGDIRTQFGLEDGMPLLAYSFKPRVGFRMDVLEDIARQVLGAGFNLVELDTRFVAEDETALNKLVELAARLAGEKRKHIGRLSINLSLPSDLALTTAAQLCAKVQPPVIVKVDGGLNGMSTLQSMRRHDLRSGNGCPPIITCYPLLRSTLSQYVPQAEFVAALASSGADIIYPGGRPDVGLMARSLSGHAREQQSLVSSVDRYRRLIRQGWPMPSVAGGIYTGQLQAFYELLGPNVAWFIGGSIALHTNGPKAGAAICVEIARRARDLRAAAGNDWADNLPADFALKCERMYEGRSSLPSDQLKYVSPKEHLAGVVDLKPFTS